MEALEDRRLLSAAPADLAAGGTAPEIPALVAPLTTSGTTGPLTISGFRQHDGGLLVDGTVLLPGQQEIDFTTSAEVRVQQSDASVTILELTLGPVDLDLLGLRVDLDRVELLVTANAGPGQVLGNLLTELLLQDPGQSMEVVGGALNTALGSGDSLMGALPLGKSLEDLDARIRQADPGGGASLLDRAFGADAATSFGTGPLGAASPSDTALPDQVRVLSLSIEELDLNVLGLRVQTLAPVDLSVTAESGPGRLLGNLFVALSSLLDPLLPEESGPANSGSSAPQSSSSMDGMGENEVPLIGLELRNVDLYLLGLEADLNVDLLVGVQTGPGNLLGNLLLDELEQIEEEVLSADFSPLEDLLGFLFDGTGAAPGTPAVAGGFGQSLISEATTGTDLGVNPAVPPAAAGTLSAKTGSTTATTEPANPDPISILDLSIDELNLELLGLFVRSEGISLELRADPGPGALLGNLLARLLGGFSEVPSPTVPSDAASKAPAQVQSAGPLVIQAEDYDDATGVNVKKGAVTKFNDGDVLVYEDVDLSGVTEFTARLSVPKSRDGQVIELRLGSPDGELVGELAPQGTGGWKKFSDQSTSIKAVSGVHDLYLVGRGSNPGRDIARLDSFSFARDPIATAVAGSFGVEPWTFGPTDDLSDDEAGSPAAQLVA